MAFIRALILLLALAPTLGAAPLPTNLGLVAETLDQAAARALAKLQAMKGADPLHGPLLIEAQSEHPANWMADHILCERLLQSGFEVVLDSTSAPSEAMRLSYRIVDLGIAGSSGLRGGEVRRRSRATLALRLSDRGNEVLYGQCEETVQRQDRIPRNKVEFLQHSSYAFARTEIEEQSLGKFVEPVIVSTVLGGLVYLFFSNR